MFETFQLFPTFIYNEEHKQYTDPNGNIYPEDILNKAVDQYMVNCIPNNRSLGTAYNTPEEIKFDLHLINVSHVLINIHKDKEKYFGKFQILPTPKGKLLASLIEHKLVRSSVVAMSSLSGSMVTNNYAIRRFDFMIKENN